MQTVLAYLKNPYVMAAAIGGGAFVGFTMLDVPMIEQYAGPLTIGIIAAAIYLAYKYWTGSLALPIVGRRVVPFPVMSQSSAVENYDQPMMARHMATSMADLLGPDQF
jgi:hypothetical protein